MRPLIQEVQSTHTPESLVEALGKNCGCVLLRTAQFDSPAARYSFVTADPFLTFRSYGSQCEISTRGDQTPSCKTQFGDPWHLLDSLMARFELLDEIDWPFPLGGAFGYWGYDLKNFTEPRLPRRAVNDLELPDCHVGFYDSLVVFDHKLGTACIISTGVDADGSRSEARAGERMTFWKQYLSTPIDRAPTAERRLANYGCADKSPESFSSHEKGNTVSNMSRTEFLAAVERIQRYIRSGDIYQANLSHRLTAHVNLSGWEMFNRLAAVSPAPYAAFLECGNENGGGGFQIASSSPEQFLRMSGSHIVTRPIKGTRPRDADATRDAQLAYELQTSSKELAELVMITDLLRNDLGKVCEYGSVQVPDLARLEKFAQVQHLVSTVEGRLRNGVTHFAAFASCFPGGSITGAPKFRAMEIIDELETVSRGPYCGAIGYLGFNRESQLSITIRTAICQPDVVHFNVGAGIVADSTPESEYQETLAKARGFLAALNMGSVDERIKLHFSAD